MKQLLLLFRRGPHGVNLAREGLDTALAASAFEVPMTLVFDGDGVYLLLSDQDASAIGEKTLGANFAALPMFEIEDLRVHGPSLAERGLTPQDLMLPVRIIDDAGLGEAIGAADQVLSF